MDDLNMMWFRFLHHTTSSIQEYFPAYIILILQGHDSYHSSRIHFPEFPPISADPQNDRPFVTANDVYINWRALKSSLQYRNINPGIHKSQVRNALNVPNIPLPIYIFLLSIHTSSFLPLTISPFAFDWRTCSRISNSSSLPI